MRLSRSQRRTGTRRPQRGAAVGRVRLSNVTDDAVVDGPQSGGAGWAEGRDPAAARPPRRRGAADPAWRVALDDEAFVVDARVGCTVGRAARRGSRAPACGRWPGSIPESDSLWTRRLTGVSRTWLSQNPGPPNLARETIARIPAPPRSRRVSSSRRRAPRPSKSPGIHRKNSGPPPSDPGVRASAGLGGGESVCNI